MIHKMLSYCSIIAYYACLTFHTDEWLTNCDRSGLQFPGMKCNVKHATDVEADVPRICQQRIKSAFLFRAKSLYMGVSVNGGTPKTPQNDHF